MTSCSDFLRIFGKYAECLGDTVECAHMTTWTTEDLVRLGMAVDCELERRAIEAERPNGQYDDHA